MDYICDECGKRYSTSTKKSHCNCGGLFSLDYKVLNFSLDLVDKSMWNLFRYKNFLPIDNKISKSISLGEGLSPIVKFDENILLKMDYFMPTLSFKDRGAAVLVSHIKSLGIEEVVQDSSGNAGNSIAAYCAKAGIKCTIYVPENTSSKKINMIKSTGADVIVVKGSRDHCADICRQRVEEENIYYANHVYNPYFYEGTKTYIYEVYEELKRIPNNIIVPVGNGTLYFGIIKGLEELLESKVIEKMPQIIAVQSEYCNPLYRAYIENKEDIDKLEARETLAEGIAIAEPKRAKKILKLAKKYNIKFVQAREDEIIKSKEELAKSGIYIEYTTAANYAGYKEYCRIYGSTKDTLIPMCGAGLKSDK